MLIGGGSEGWTKIGDIGTPVSSEEIHAGQAGRLAWSATCVLFCWYACGSVSLRCVSCGQLRTNKCQMTTSCSGWREWEMGPGRGSRVHLSTQAHARQLDLQLQQPTIADPQIHKAGAQ